jgi:CO/xanthine dehydrogenase Mo-binding subunit
VSAPSGRRPAPPLPGSLAANPSIGAWLDFADDGVVTIRAGKVEYGQGVWTALAQVAAEELDVSLDRVRVAPVSTDTSPDEGTTSGSRSIEESGTALRQVCAQARALFLAAAAGQLGEDAGNLSVDDGRIQARGDVTTLSYWSLYRPGLLDREAAVAVPVKDPGRWSIAGHSAPRRDIPGKVVGRPSFLHDMVLPGMLFGRVVRPPGRAAVLEELGDVALPPGVVATVRDGSFLGVVAETDRAALTAAGLLARAARWSVREPLPDERDLKAFLLSRPAETLTVDERRDETAAATAATNLTGEFTRPFIAHASMAPSCAIARSDSGTVTVWSHSQGIFALRGALADGLGLPRTSVVVHHAEGAGVYGHNGADDVAADAVLLARKVEGRPVRVQWSREDELGWAPLGPAMLARLAAGLDGSGRIMTWRQDVWSNGFIGRPGSGGEPRLLAFADAGGKPIAPSLDGPPTGAMGSTRNAVPCYDVPDRVITRHRLLDMPIRTSSLRSLGGFLNVFAIESFMDELAAAAGADPVGFRLAHLSDPRARRVIEEAAGMSGWAGRVGQHPPGEGVGLGVGFARYKGTSGYCAAVAEVEAETSIRVRRLWLAVDVGRVISPDGVINQVEGGAVQSASWTLAERVRFDRARVISVNWDTYPILRFTDVPDVTVRIVEPPGERETGAGEVAQGPVAGAIGNAVSHAVGARVRDLPLTTEQVSRAIEQSTS